MIIKPADGSNPNGTGTVVNMRCPACRQLGTFEAFDKIVDLIQSLRDDSDNSITSYILGQRRCPNNICKAHIFFVHNMNTQTVVISYPAETIDFDSTSLPSNVLSALEEAITCHANRCFVASAIMIRKTMEELCLDRGATGPNLKERIKQLQTKIILPQELLDGLDDLRLLGNDAAHIESQHYNKIGKEEVELGIEVTKEILKAVYQYNSLISKLKALKK
jgi:hypothetical protein